jgi:hypothetical protein
MKSFHEFILGADACYSALDWVKGHGLKWCYSHCDRPDWMVWYLNQLYIRGIKVDIKPLRKLVKKWKKSSVFNKVWKNKYDGDFSCGDFLILTHRVLYDLYDRCWHYDLEDGKRLCDDIRDAYPIPPNWK